MVEYNMKTSKTVIFIFALAAGAASADLRSNRSRDYDDSRPRTGIKDGVKNLAKEIWGGIRYQKNAIEETLRGVKDDIRGNERRPEPQPEYQNGERYYEDARPDYRSGPYRRDERVRDDRGDFLEPEPLWKDHERQLEKRRAAEAAQGYQDRRGEPLPSPTINQPQLEPRMDPRRQRAEDLYGPVGGVVRSENPANTAGNRSGTNQNLPEYEEAVVEPLGNAGDRVKAPTQPMTPKKEVSVQPKVNSPSTPKPKVDSPKTEVKKSGTTNGKTTDFPKASKTKKEGVVLSPYPPYDLLDVNGLDSGSLAKDPKTGQIFRVP